MAHSLKEQEKVVVDSDKESWAIGSEDDDFILFENDDSDIDSPVKSNTRGGRCDVGRGSRGGEANWSDIQGKDKQLPRIPFEPTMLGFYASSKEPMSELNFFKMYFSNDLLKCIVEETNRYAAIQIMKFSPPTQYFQWQRWDDISIQEITAFLGVILNMAVNDNPNHQDFFSDDWTVWEPFFKYIFSRHRFFQIFQALHVADPAPVASVADLTNDCVQWYRISKSQQLKHLFAQT